MATYPLKNISIGGNTYQISGSDKYHCMITGPSVSDLVDIYQFNNTNISTAYLSVIKNFTVVSNPGETLINMVNNDEQCVHLNYGSINASDLYLKSVEFTGTSTDPIDFYFESEVYEASGTAYVSQVVIRVSGASPYSIISITGKKIACGGGGGGGSTLVLRPFNWSMDDYCSFADTLSGNISFQDSAQNELNFSDLATAFESGRVILKDTTNSFATIVALNTYNNSMVFEYMSSGNLTKVRATDQYDSASWECMSIS